MTWKTDSITFIQCDAAVHQGDPISKISTKPGFSAVDALVRNGWSQRLRPLAHFCPTCAKIIKGGR